MVTNPPWLILCRVLPTQKEAINTMEAELLSQLKTITSKAFKLKSFLESSLINDLPSLIFRDKLTLYEKMTCFQQKEKASLPLERLSTDELNPPDLKLSGEL